MINQTINQFVFIINIVDIKMGDWDYIKYNFVGWVLAI